MRVGRWIVAGLLLFSSLGCQIGYYFHSAYNQSKLNHRRKPIERVLTSPDLNDEQKAKLRLVQEAKAFAEQDLGLKASPNYTSYVQLDEDYVTYIVQAAYADELKPYLWKFPFVGEVPYKGYFKKSMADDEARSFDHSKYDTYVRGVSAYSTLGWFQDSVLSSMLRYADYDLVETILHETVHTTLYIKNAAEFNERMATFLGQEGMRLFYRHKKGDYSSQLSKADDDAHDQRLFSAFLTKEIEELKKWYLANKGQVTPESKAARLKELQTRFSTQLKAQLKTKNYNEFETRELNNAYLLAYQTYEYGLDDFQKLYAHFANDFKQTMAYLLTLEKDPKPDQTLRDFVARSAITPAGK